jgi:spermidine synthase
LVCSTLGNAFKTLFSASVTERSSVRTSILSALTDMSDARVRVAELVPAVIEWARGPLCDTFGGCLEDVRVDIVVADVGDVMGAARANYDAILLDVDNGPDGLTRISNDRLYGSAGLSAARIAIKPEGLLAVWSANPSDRFSRRLRDAGFEVEIHQVRARRDKGARHTLWISSAV